MMYLNMLNANLSLMSDQVLTNAIQEIAQDNLKAQKAPSNIGIVCHSCKKLINHSSMQDYLIN